jgi:uncharacterized protein
MSAYEATSRTRLRRKPGRAHYERETVHAIIDEALTCHIGFVVDDQPYVIPTVHARIGETLYFHGSPDNRMLTTLATGARCCVTVTLADGLVLARSAKKHSFNYRSVVVLGTAQEVTEPEDKMAALLSIIEHAIPGRTADLEPPAADLDSVAVLAITLKEASAKVRTGGPNDRPADLNRPIWAGHLPLSIAPGNPLPTPDLPDQVPIPSYIRQWHRGA